MELSSLQLCFLIIFLLLFITAVVLKRSSNSLKKFSSHVSDEIQGTKTEVKQYTNVFFFLSFLVIFIYTAYFFTAKYQLESHVLEWVQLVIRWTHVVFGMAWIGASFYFIFLENSLNRTTNLRDELAGNLWAIHGGGFYYVEKYKTAPTEIPKTLHWFKYEAYFTWLTGFLLMTIVYYMNAKAFMIDPSVSNIASTTAIWLGIGTVVLGWILYDILCRSSLLQKKKMFALIGFSIVIIISFILSKFLSGRAAFIHIGALLGTIMAGNVFFVIIPSQKAMVKAAKVGIPLDPAIGKYAGLRSLHNNYITLPVIFIMISNHFPSTFGNQFNWAVLAGLTLASVAVRHFINLHEKGQQARWMIPFAAIALIALVIVTAPHSSLNSGNKSAVTFAQVQPIIKIRCQTCHSKSPTDEIQKIAPNGVQFDTPDEIKKHADRILFRAVQTRTMPQGNKTGITDDERNLIGRWIEGGAVIPPVQ